MDKEAKEKEKSEYRKKRVKYIKRGIVTIIIMTMIIPTILSAFLMYKVHVLENEIKRLSQTKTKKQTEENVINAKEVTKTDVTKPTEEEEKKVYLTFDDGPSQQTERILDILKKENVKATFFVIGHTDAFSKKMYQRMVKEGHTLGMHSYSHIYSEIYSSKKSFEKDFIKLQNYLQDVTGVTSLYYRFPGGSSYSGIPGSVQEFIQILNDKGISYMDWNVVDGSNTGTKITKDELVQNVLNDVSAFSTSIVQLHDSSDKKVTADALEDLILQLKEQRYELLPIDNETRPVRHVE